MIMKIETSMKTKRALYCGLSFLMSMSVGQSAWAEDIEIYQAVFNTDQSIGDSRTNDPNVLFVLDNSGSMGSYRLIQEGPAQGLGPYDPSVDYGGGDRDTNIYLYSTNMVYQGIELKSQQNVCKAAQNAFANNPNLPIHQDKYIQWTKYSGNEYGWTISYLQSDSNKEVFECQDDNGIHGRTNNAKGKFPRKCSVNTELC